jgi:NADP-dependent 3-hydroxy acid dehydrogenase YdfG
MIEMIFCNIYFLANSVIVITGASSGIGKELTLKYAERGARIIIGARSLESLEKVISVF